MFEKLFEKMLILADEGEFVSLKYKIISVNLISSIFSSLLLSTNQFSGAMPSISSDTTDFTLTHASNGFNMDYYVKPLAKSAVIFNVKTLKINDEKVSVHLKNIKLSFNDANNVQELFKVNNFISIFNEFLRFHSNHVWGFFLFGYRCPKIAKTLRLKLKFSMILSTKSNSLLQKAVCVCHQAYSTQLSG